jgi:hypothetical protein
VGVRLSARCYRATYNSNLRSEVATNGLSKYGNGRFRGTAHRWDRFHILAGMRTIFVFIATLTMGLTAGQTPPLHPAVPLQVSLCDIKAHPDMFLHKLVEFTATASHGFEDSMVEDSHCPWSQGRPGVWMEYGGKRSTATLYCCGISPKPDRSETLVIDGISLDLLDDNTFRAFDRRLHQRPSKPESSNTVRATLRGRIFARYEGIGGSRQNPEWRGYGNMGCCMLFVVAQVVSIDSAQR